jgi:hypothetical protein
MILRMMWPIWAFWLVSLQCTPSLADPASVFSNKTIQSQYIRSGSVCRSGRCNEVPSTESVQNTYISANGNVFDYQVGRTGIQYKIGEWQNLPNQDQDRWDVSGTTLRYTLIQHVGSEEVHQVLTIVAQGEGVLHP